MPTMFNLAAENVSLTDLQPVLDSLTGQISVANVVAIIAAVLGACVGFAFMWWGIRFGKSKLMGAFKKGKV